MKTIKAILAGLVLVSAVALATPTQAQGTATKVLAQQTQDHLTWAEYSISGPFAGVPLSLTNGVAKLVTNALFKVPAGQGAAFSPLFVNSAISNVTCFIYVSTTSTNADDFSTIPLLARSPGTATGSVRPWTNWTATALSGVRWLKWGAVSNDAGAGLTEVTVTLSNGVFSAHVP